MENLILFGSKYGCTRKYAEVLSNQTGIPALSYQNAPMLSDKRTIIYLGGLYAGGVLGLSKTLRVSPLSDEQKLILVTVGLADPREPENQNSIRNSLKKQLPAKLFHRSKIFHLRGAINYSKLSL